MVEPTNASDECTADVETCDVLQQDAETEDLRSGLSNFGKLRRPSADQIAAAIEDVETVTLPTVTDADD